MNASQTGIKPEPLGHIGTDDKWAVLRTYKFKFDDFIHGAMGEIGPWPQPAPDNPVRQIAQVIHLPESELDDWKQNVSNVYRRLVLTRWPKGLHYIFKHKHYKRFTDSNFNEEITEGLYSKFLTQLDQGDLDLFKTKIPGLKSADCYYKADFSCMEPIEGNCYEGMFAAPSITLLEKNVGDVVGQKHKVLAIYMYSTLQGNSNQDGQVFIPGDGKHWELAKYYVLQGAVHRVNLTEHALLHFPFDSINAITRSVLPKDHVLFKLLFPHLRLSLPVNKAVLENPGSLINRDKSVFYSPFCAPGKYVRELLADGYIGREGKPNAYPEYKFPLKPKIPDSVFGVYLQRYYEVFQQFVDKVLQQLVAGNDAEQNNKDREMIGLWAECISEWIPGFPNRKDLKIDQQALDVDLLSQVLTMILWDLSLAHGTDHICIHNKQSHGNPFRLRVPPPGKGKIADDWYERLVTRWDLLSAWFTDLLFYEPNNVALLQEVDYGFNEPQLIQAQQDFLQALHDLDKELKTSNTQVASLDQIPTSIQY